MNHRIDDLYIRRGRLLERIASQRATLAHDLQPVRIALYSTDRLIDRVRSSVDYVKQHPSIIVIAAVSLSFMGSGRVWRWSRRALVAWQTLRTLRERLISLGLRVKS